MEMAFPTYKYVLLSAKRKCWPNKSVARQNVKKTISMLGAKRECCLANPVIYFYINMKEKKNKALVKVLRIRNIL